MLSGGSVFVSLGAHVARTGFDEYAKFVSGAKAEKFHNIRLGGDVVKDGFERYARSVRAAQTQTRDFAAASDKYYGSIGDAVRGMGTEATKYLGLTREQLGYTAREYETVAAAAQHSADVQRAAAAEGSKGVTALGAASAGAAAKAEAGWKKGFNTLANVGKYTSIATVAVGAVGVKMAADFGKQMELVHTQAGYSQQSVDHLKKSVENLAPAVGIGPKQLAEGLYHVASEGIPAGHAIEVLSVAAKGARIGNDDLTSVVNALTAAMKAFRIPTKDAAATMGELDRIAGQGNMVMKDLTAAMTTGVLGAAKAVGLQLRDVGAALDTLTRQGVPAQEGATRLRTVLGLIANPTAKAQKALAELGFSQDRLAKDFREKGLVGALQDLHNSMDHVFGRKLNVDEQRAAIQKYQQTLIASGVTGKSLDNQVKAFTHSLQKQGEGAIQSSQLIAQAFGGARMGTTMQILMQNIDEVAQHTKSLGVSTKQNTDLFNQHWKDTEKLFSQQAAQLWAGIQRIAIAIGNFLIPVLEKAAKGLIQFGNFLGHHKVLADALAVTLGVTLVAAVLAFFARLGIKIVEGTKSIGTFIKWLVGLGDTSKKTTDTIVTGQEAQTKAIQTTTAAIEEQGAAAMAAAKELGIYAATGEEVTAGGVLLPRGASRGGVSSAVRAEQAAAAGSPLVPLGGGARGGMGGVRGVLGTGASRVGRGFGVGLLGVTGAQLIGGAVGGKAGRAISGIGSDAAMGAAFGSLFGPEGTVGGAIVGGLVGSIATFVKKGPTEGQKMAKSLMGPLSNIPVGLDKKTYQKQADAAGKDIARHIDNAQKAATPKPGPTHPPGAGPGSGAPLGPGADPFAPPSTHVSPANRRRSESEWTAAGVSMARWIQHGFNVGAKYFTEKDVLGEVLPKLQKMNPTMRNAGAQSMIQWAHGMEAEHRLPVGATDKLIKDLEAKYPALRAYLKSQATGTNKDVAQELGNKRVIDTVQGQIDDFRKLWFDAPKIAHSDAHNVYLNWKTEMEALRTALKHTHGGTRADLLKVYNQMKGDSRAAAGVVANHWLNSTAGMSRGVAHNLQSLLTTFVQAYGEISSDTSQAVKVFGVKAIKFGLSHPGTVKAGKLYDTLNTDLQVGNAAAIGHTQATGGIPAPSASHRDDHLVVNPQGQPVAAISGSEGIVNTPQMEEINRWGTVAKAMGFSAYGNLDELWHSGMLHRAQGGQLVRRAGGGYVFPVPKGVGFSWNRIDQGQDMQEKQGGKPYLAIGPGVVTVAPPNPGGFGNHYPLLHLSGGPWKGRTIYYGHTKTIKQGAVQAGTAISLGGPPGASNDWQGNAKGLTGWAEIGLWPPGGMSAGNAIAPLLHALAGDRVGAGAFGVGSVPNVQITQHARGGRASSGSSSGFVPMDIANIFINKIVSEANKYINKQVPSAAFGSDPGPAPVGNIMQLAQAAAKAAGVPWNPTIVRTLLGKESSGGKNLPPSGGTSSGPPAGPFQVTTGTFKSYAAPGHSNLMNPWDNALAAFRYIKARYHTLQNLASQTGLMGGSYKGYKLGGLFKRFQGGGRLHAASVRHSHTPGTLHSGHQAVHRHKPSTTQVNAAVTAATKVPPLAQTKRHSLVASLTGRYANLPGVQAFDDADAAAQAVDATYGSDERYFGLVDASLTSSDLSTLLGLREQQSQLFAAELTQGESTLGLLHEAGSQTQGEYTQLHGTAVGVAAQINHIKEKLKQEGRRLRREQHKRAGKLMGLADNLAGQLSKKADQRDALNNQERTIRRRHRDRITKLQNTYVPDVSGQVRSIRASYQTRIANEPTTAGRRSLQRQRDAAIAGVQAGPKAIRQRITRGVRDERTAQARELDPITKARASIGTDMRHLREQEGKQRRKYQHQGWAQAWAITTQKWKLQDKLTKLQAEEKDLSGSTTGVGKGGELGQLMATLTNIQGATTAVEGRQTQTQQAQVDNALNQLDIADQEAQARATETGQPVDVADLLPPDAVSVLQHAGIVTGAIHRVFQPEPSTTGTDTTGGTTDTTSVAAQALAQISAMDTASQQLFQQFGSNFVAANPTALKSALAGAGTPLAPGVAYFGAAGPSGAVASGVAYPGSSPNEVQPAFQQNNYYQTGPEDPHIHAQASLVEFNTAFG